MKLLLVDDHALFREGLALLLKDLHADLQLVHAANVEEAYRQAAQQDFDLILLDLGLPDESGMIALEHLRAAYESLPVVVLSSRDDQDTVLDAINRGAMGFIPKSVSSAVMLDALRVILDRGIYMPHVAQPGYVPVTVPATTSAQTHPAVTPEALGLTPRQAEVLYQILQGKPIKLIARALNFSENTAKSHVSAILRALNVTTRTQAIVAASRLNLRFPEPAKDAAAAKS